VHKLPYKILQRTLPFLLILAVFNLTACAFNSGRVPGSLSTPNDVAAHTVAGVVVGGVVGRIAKNSIGSIATGAVVGGVVGTVVGIYSERPAKYIGKLTEQGIQVVQLGDNVTVILPSDQCFEQGTATITYACEPIMQNLAALFKLYDNAPITITGYTDDVGEPSQARLLTYYQADSVLTYLWAHGIPFRQMTAIGKGADCNVATNDTVAGSAANRHIEIAVRLNT